MKKIIYILTLIFTIFLISGCKKINQYYKVNQDGNFIIKPNQPKEGYLKGTKIDFRIDPNKIPQGMEVSKIIFNGEELNKNKSQYNKKIIKDSYIKASFKQIPEGYYRLTFDKPETVITDETNYKLYKEGSKIIFKAPKYYKFSNVFINGKLTPINDIIFNHEIKKDTHIEIKKESLVRTHVRIKFKIINTDKVKVKEPLNIEISKVGETLLNNYKITEYEVPIGDKLTLNIEENYTLDTIKINGEKTHFHKNTNTYDIIAKPDHDILEIIIENSFISIARETVTLKDDNLIFIDKQRKKEIVSGKEITIYSKDFRLIKTLIIKDLDNNLIKEIEDINSVYYDLLVENKSVNIEAYYSENKDISSIDITTKDHLEFDINEPIIIDKEDGYLITESKKLNKKIITFLKPGKYSIIDKDIRNNNKIKRYNVVYDVLEIRVNNPINIKDFQNTKNINKYIGINNAYIYNINVLTELIMLENDGFKPFLLTLKENEYNIDIYKVYEFNEDEDLYLYIDSNFKNHNQIKFKKESINKELTIVYKVSIGNKEFYVSEKVIPVVGLNIYRSQDLINNLKNVNKNNNNLLIQNNIILENTSLKLIDLEENNININGNYFNIDLSNINKENKFILDSNKAVNLSIKNLSFISRQIIYPNISFNNINLIIDNIVFKNINLRYYINIILNNDILKINSKFTKKGTFNED